MIYVSAPIVSNILASPRILINTTKYLLLVPYRVPPLPPLTPRSPTLILVCTVEVIYLVIGVFEEMLC